VLRRFLLVATVASQALGAEYRDPGGRFSIDLPQGWSSSPSPNGTYFVAGNAYALATVVANGGANPSQVAAFTDQFGKQWSNYRRLQSGNATVAGQAGAFAVYAGTPPKGGDAVLKALSTPVGNDALVLLFSAPASEWAGRKTAFEQMERGLRLGRPAGGLSVVSRSGRIGQALSGALSGGGPARRSFRTAFQMAAPLFDGQPRLQGAFANAADTEVQAFFRASHRGIPVRGWMSVSGARAALAFDEEAQFSRSFPQLMQALGGDAPAGAAPSRARAPVQLTRQQFPDGSGSIGLAPGWRIGSSWKGIVDIHGPNGETGIFGYYQQVLVNWIGPPSPVPGAIYGRIRNPASALAAYCDSYTKGAVSRGQATFRIIETAPMQPLTAGSQTAMFLVEVRSGQSAVRSLALVSVAPIDSENWIYYMSAVTAPEQLFAERLPVMMQMWSSWGISQALVMERMQNAMRSMRETTAILQGVNDNMRRAGERSNLAWSQTIRGVTTIENTATGGRADVDTNLVDRIVRGLNEEGYSYRIVPLPELIP
jgi:hypothetical protein